MHATKPLKLEIAKTMKLAGTMTRKRNDADNSIMEVAVVMTIISSAKKLVLVDANENNYRQHHHHSHRHQQKVNWNHLDKSIAYYNQTVDHAEQFNRGTSTTVKPVFAMFLHTEDVVAIKTTSNRLRIAKIAVEMYKICVVCRQFMVVAKKMLHATIMRVALMSVLHLNTAVVVETRTISTQFQNVNLNVNVSADQNNSPNSLILTMLVIDYSIGH